MKKGNRSKLALIKFISDETIQIRNFELVDHTEEIGQPNHTGFGRCRAYNGMTTLTIQVKKVIRKYDKK